MLLTGWEVRIGKNFDRGLENAALGLRRLQHFQTRGHSFSQYGPTLSRPITCLSFSFTCRKLAYKWVCLSNFVIESAYTPSTNHSMGEKSVETLGSKIRFSSVLAWTYFSPCPKTMLIFLFFRLYITQHLENIELGGRAYQKINARCK